MRLQRLCPAFLVALALAAAGCGSSSSSSAGADPAQVMPASSLSYLEGVVRPEGAQKQNVDKLLARFDQAGVSVTGKLRAAIDHGLRSADNTASYERDVAPWLGQRVGVGVTDVAASADAGYIIAAAVTDTSKAKAFIQAQTKGGKAGSYKDTDYVVEDDDTAIGLVGDFLVVARSAAELKQAVDASQGDSLGDADRFRTAIDKLPQERLGAAYFDLKRLSSLIAAQSTAEDRAATGIITKLLGDMPPITAALTVTSDAATIESRFSGALGLFGPLGSGGKSTPLVRDAPEGSFAVLGASGVGASLRQTLKTFAGALGGAALTGQLEQQTGVNLDRDVFSWVGDVAVFARGASLSGLGGAAVISATDEGAARAAIPRLVAAAKRSGAPVQGTSVAGADQAFSVRMSGAPGPVVLAQAGDRVVLALGEDTAAEALKPAKTIDDSGLYGRAKDAIDGLDPSLILDGPRVVSLVDALAGNDPDYRQAKPYLDMLDLVASGSEKDGDELRSLFTVKVK